MNNTEYKGDWINGYPDGNGIFYFNSKIIDAYIFKLRSKIIFFP